MIYNFTMNDDYTDDQKAKLKEAFDAQWDSLNSTMDSAKQELASSLGIKAEDIGIKMVYNDKDGNEIASHEF